ncbi:Riboflavin synthase-like beta-barrel [Penicillium coprophilum]|uniref:Riboflavin synthase-like beta-barrel n=1 Tax=Penicillium coprophilum TaxID=36646 RepID=UPI002385434D|nr:Riboflavin synthase-like beta-barrel [Penicillium coprophilum]KAJ5164001.1 Riboflavin synthase-like beta-barrel [Penicillium coprophilum]
MGLAPSAVLVAGVYAVKPEFLAYAIALAVMLAGYLVFSTLNAEPRKVLNPTEFQDFVLKEKNEISHNVAIYRFALPRPTDILGLPIGQHISLAATIAGQPKEVVRSYTPISSDNEAGYFDLLVKAYPQGNISKYLTELKIGDNMKVRGPKGAMVYTPNMCRHIGMISGGTGITPMLQVIKAIIRNRPRNGGNDTTKVDLIFANVNPEDILLKDQLEALEKEDDGFRVYYVLNNPPEGWTGGVGFVTPDMIKERLPAPAADVKIFLCGPPSHDQRHEEVHRGSWIHQGAPRQQAGGPGLLLLSDSLRTKSCCFKACLCHSIFK